MHIFHTVDEMRSWSEKQRGLGRRIAFVPTMGALHEGHKSLMRAGTKLADSLVASVYVNPTQFGPNEDLDSYPKSLDADLEKCKAVGVKALFVPDDKAIYPDGYQTYVSIEGITGKLCGASRPTHFRGVTTVVAKLFNIVLPHVAIFGEKDYQQLVVIRRMVRDLDMPIEIVGCPTVRESDGLAMSSRNRYLTPEERRAAISLNESLGVAERMIAAGTSDSTEILARVRGIIGSHPSMRIDYAKIVDAETLEDMETVNRPAVVALAAFAGPTRLIDNRLFEQG